MSKSLIHFQKISDNTIFIYHVGRNIGRFSWDKYSCQWKLNITNDLFWRDAQEISYEFEDYIAANA